jgi:molybdenum cofactor cytidylyltransferase
MIAGLILAAGESSRMGTDKALLIYRGRTFLEGIIATLNESGISRIVVVLGHHAEDIRRTVNLRGAEVVVNQNYSQGQTSSLQAGLQALISPELEAILLCLVDHPAASAQTIRELIAGFRKSPSTVVIPTYRNQRGHPVLIARALFDELLQLGTEAGANSVIRRHRPQTSLIEVEDPGVLVDVDDPEAYQKLEQ